jgi:hypothetical protein
MGASGDANAYCADTKSAEALGVRDRTEEHTHVIALEIREFLLGHRCHGGAGGRMRAKCYRRRRRWKRLRGQQRSNAGRQWQWERKLVERKRRLVGWEWRHLEQRWGRQRGISGRKHGKLVERKQQWW